MDRSKPRCAKWRSRSAGSSSTVKTLTQQWRDQDGKASLGRRDLHQKIDALVEDLRTLEGLIRAAISDIFHETDRRWRCRGKGTGQGCGQASRWVHWLVFGSGGGATALRAASHYFQGDAEMRRA
ncbi:DUF1515 family protein [Bradyrhizobium sp. BR 1432]|uniref:DUF1515 family protein n=1 Tax=Bradyrhizobium sp. BR 1432 TaxID=3447966 RepID=UPI003EE64069